MLNRLASHRARAGESCASTQTVISSGNEDGMIDLSSGVLQTSPQILRLEIRQLFEDLLAG
jgi:hypothetical protein